MRGWAPSHRPVLPFGEQPSDKLAVYVGKRKWQLRHQVPALPPNSSSTSSSLGPITTADVSSLCGLCETICPVSTLVSSDGSARWKRRLVPRIVVTSDTSALGGVLPKVAIKFLGANCSADPDGVRPLLADPVQMGSFSSPRQTPSLLTGGVGDALILPLPKSSDSVLGAALGD